MKSLMQSRFWLQPIAWMKKIIHPRRWLAILAVTASIVVWGCSSSVQAGGQADPKLKEQVLQIIRENPEVILESVRAYQQQQQQAGEKTRQSFLQAMKTDRKSVIGQSPTKGAQNGQILLIEFSDFQCPYCAKAQDTLKEMMSKYSGKVTLVYKHFPLTSIHPEALPAAKAAWAAGQQGKFWEYHDALFQQQKNLGDGLYKQIAKDLKLDEKKFDSDRNSAAATAAIDQDTQTAEKLGIDGTPFFLASGANFSGAIQLPDLEAVLAKANNL